MGVLKNIVSFGAHGRIERKIEENDDLQSKYQQLHAKMEDKRIQVNDKLEEVIEAKIAAVKSLKKISKLSKNLQSKERDIVDQKFENSMGTANFNQIDATITAGTMAMNASKGLSTGVGTAVGAWALASTFGTASTGTALAGLSGAAATNATLAWFGGGALAAGGGGMAAGTAVIGGLVAIPALALTGVISHIQANKKITEIEKNMAEVIKLMDQVQANILKMDLINKRSEELILSLEKSNQVFEEEFQKVFKEIYRVPFISRSVKWMRKTLLRRNYFSKKDYENIAYIGGIASNFALLIDTKVFEEEEQ
ncbi:hypothetical protein [Planomicrobium sp. CPCC 101110]|uniref:hypothetical protein n=1 Tax=Planomicrobium sp. CPCC 101110 TaxID=2599619 RepID=UPI0011B5E8DF|nr:hypothetical protein [Planomicrobium sp. CPCC 101110]TWT27728.1 hypothetical protein FQV30_04230 [Planomicrobium sp. CPCC 101110]